MFLFSKQKQSHRSSRLDASLLLLLLFFCVLLLYAVPLYSALAEEGAVEKAAATETQIIISLAPSITELLAYLGATTPSTSSKSTLHLVGVSTYCDYPKWVNGLPRVGSLAKAQFERIIMMQPDLLLGVRDASGLRDKARAFGIEAEFYPQRSLEEVYTSIREIAARVDAEERGAKLVARLQEAIAQATLPEAKGKRAVLLFWESLQETRMYAAGSASLDEELLEAIGLENALQTKQPYAPLSLEGLLSLTPDIVIVLAPGVMQERAEQRVQEFRQTVESLSAIEPSKILLLNDSAFMRPGPRTVEALEMLRQAVAAALLGEGQRK